MSRPQQWGLINSILSSRACSSAIAEAASRCSRQSPDQICQRAPDGNVFRLLVNADRTRLLLRCFHISSFAVPPCGIDNLITTPERTERCMAFGYPQSDLNLTT